MTPHFVENLVLESDAGEGDGATVVLPFVYYSVVLGAFVTVPAGFHTDLASVPRLPVVYLLVGGRGDEAAVIHDFLYTEQPCTRKQADDVFYEALLTMGVPRWQAWMMWCGVRAGGASHWKTRPLKAPEAA